MAMSTVYNVTRNLCAATAMPRLSRKMSQILEANAANETAHFETLAVSISKNFVAQVELRRPSNFNAFNKQMWSEIKECFEQLSVNPDCRVIVVSAAGKHFTAGIDLTDMIKLGQELAEIDDVARKGVVLERVIKLYQDSLSSLERCPKPVILAVHSACIGAGIDLITAGDIRYCSKDAFFQVAEVNIGMAADVGTLQRLPKIVGNTSLARELCYTARRFDSAEASSMGLISKVFEDKEALLQGALQLAETIAEKSPIAVQATKQSIVYSQNHTNQQGLDHIREMNKLYLQSEDFLNAAAAQLTKGEKPVFSKL